MSVVTRWALVVTTALSAAGCEMLVGPKAPVDGGSAETCDADLETDLNNCGKCGRVCGSKNGTATCSQGVCQIACNEGFADCDHDTGTGCEADLANDLENCTACGQKCGTDHASATCEVWGCELTCTAPFHNCDGASENGCETDTSSLLEHCGTCDNHCDSIGGTAIACSAGKCVFECSAGLGDCDGDGTNGCETDVMNDGENCSACGHSCNGGPCNAGQCGSAPTLVATAEVFPSSIAVDDQYVYWAEFNYSGKIKRAPKAGGGQTETLATSINDARALAIDGSALYFASGSAIYRWDKATKTTTQLTGGFGPLHLAQDATNLYFAHRTTNGAVAKVPKAGGATVELTTGDYPEFVVPLGSEILFDEFMTGSLKRLAGGAVTTIYTGASENISMVTDGAIAYAVTDRLLKISPGTAPVDLGPGCGGLVGESALDANFIYAPCWSYVKRFRRSDGLPTNVWNSSKSESRSVAIDASYVYWTVDSIADNTGTGPTGIYRVAR